MNPETINDLEPEAGQADAVRGGEGERREKKKQQGKKDDDHRTPDEPK